MKIIISYITYFILISIFLDQVELSGWDMLLLFASTLSAVYCGITIGEKDKNESK